jgi:multiple sugar transport system permease protein
VFRIRIGQRDVEGYLFLLPWLIGLVIFRLVSIVASAGLSLMSWDLLQPPHFVGLQNYQDLFADNLFWTSLFNTLYYVVGSVPLSLILALLAAFLLNRPLPGVGVLRTVYYLPSVTTGVAVALLWQWMFEPTYGVIDTILGWFHVPGPPWLGSTTWAMPALILMSTWGIGSAMVIFLAGLKGVPQHLYEAAAIDGASGWHQFWNVTVPMLTPVIFFNLIIGIISSFQVFTQAYVMTNGGPANATLVYILYLYNQGFSWLHMGYASALAWILFIIVLGLTTFIFRRSAWVYYEGAGR